MRSDDVGLFWQDYQTKGKYDQNRPIPPIPMTGWRPPEEYPDLSGAEKIAIDTETNDPELKEMGPGTKRDGYIVGLSVAVPTGEKWYFPIGHKMGGNLPREHVLHWARDNLTRPNQPKLGANILYDLDYLAEAGVDVSGPFEDVQIAEPLLDELALSYDLESILQRHLGYGKKNDELYDWCSKAFGGPATPDSQAKNIWRAPVQLVGPYAEGDVAPLFECLEKQKALLDAEGLNGIFQLESDLTPVLLAMRRRGVRVDVDAAQALGDKIQPEIDRLKKSIGVTSVDEKDQLIAICKREGITIPTTEKGNPSFVKKWLENNPHAAMRTVTEIRSLEKLKGTFLEGHILGHHVGGRIYSQFNQLRSDLWGAVSGRFSSSNPNLQNIPTRTELGKAIRMMFLPDGEDYWDRLDWSQIEFRLLTHYALGVGAEQAREMYRRNPATDFHVMVCNLINNYVPLERSAAKNINFGFVYGMGVELLCSILGVSTEQGWEILNGYHTAVPFVRRTYQAASKRAQQLHRILTILGRKRRFPEGRDTHKALNALLQGGAADIMKTAMVMAWKAGIFAPHVLGAPLITVHDELAMSVPNRPECLEAVLELKHIMETCVKINVPMMVDHERGSNWGNCKKINALLH